MARCDLTDRIRGISDDDIKLPLVVTHELKSVSDVQIQLGTTEAQRHLWQELLRDLNHFLTIHNEMLRNKYLWRLRSSNLCRLLDKGTYSPHLSHTW